MFIDSHCSRIFLLFSRVAAYDELCSLVKLGWWWVESRERGVMYLMINLVFSLNYTMFPLAWRALVNQLGLERP